MTIDIHRTSSIQSPQGFRVEAWTGTSIFDREVKVIGTYPWHWMARLVAWFWLHLKGTSCTR